MSKFRKAIVAAVTAGVSALIPVMSDGITTGEWGIVAAAVVAAFLAVYHTPNAPQ